MGFQERVLLKQRGEDPLVSLKETEVTATEESLEETAKNLKFFGIESVRGYPSCIDLRFPDGNCKAIPYTYIVEVDFDTSDGIEIITSSRKITIAGRNLQILYKYIISFRIKYIQANIGNDTSEENAVFVKEIKINELE